MLCMQQCIDLCDITPREAQAICERATLAEIVAIQSACPKVQARADDPAPAGDDVCDILDIREQLLDEVHAAETFGDLALTLNRYRAFSMARELVEPRA